MSTAIAILLSGPHFESSASEPARAKKAAITIVDQYGRQVRSSSPSATSQTFDVTVGPGATRTFSPQTVNIVAGDTVHWTWASNNHNVVSGSSCTVDSAFCSPTDTNCATSPLSSSGTEYSHTFSTPGTFSYFCSAHCFQGMTGSVIVAAPIAMIASVLRDNTGFVVSGQTNPNRTVTIQAAPNLVASFATIGTATAGGSGLFTFTDATATSLQMRFYRVTYP
jgi:plastocyanin